jgi:hypothetical protein
MSKALFSFFNFFFLVGLGFELMALYLQSRQSALKPHQSILLWLYFWDGVSNCLLGLALNLDPPNLSFPSSWY